MASAPALDLTSSLRGDLGPWEKGAASHIQQVERGYSRAIAFLNSRCSASLESLPPITFSASCIHYFGWFLHCTARCSLADCTSLFRSQRSGDTKCDPLSLQKATPQFPETGRVSEAASREHNKLQQKTVHLCHHLLRRHRHGPIAHNTALYAEQREHLHPSTSDSPSTLHSLSGRRIPSTPPPVPARKTQRSGATFRRAVFSAKEVPSAQDLLPGAQTHLPFGCSAVGVMWKPKAALNLQKNISSLSVYMVPDQWYIATCHWSSGICTGLQDRKRRFKPR